MNKSVRLVDVARAAGVSKSTASRALTDAPRIKEETRLRVARVAAELGYVRDLRAAELAGWHHRAVGMMVRGTDSAFYSELITFAQLACDRLGLELLIVNGGDGFEHQRRSLENLLERRVDGIIIASGRAEREAIIEVSRLRPVTTVGIDMKFPNADSVVIDADCEKQLAAAVSAAGHRTVGVTVAASEHSYTLSLRGRRLAQTLEGDGVKVIPVALSAAANGPVAQDLCRALDKGATAFMAGDDLQALTIMEFLNTQGVRVPADVSVTGFDGVGPFISPLLGITTMRQPVAQLLDVGISTLLRRMEKPDRRPRYKTLPGEFITGRTLAAAPGRAPATVGG